MHFGVIRAHCDTSTKVGMGHLYGTDGPSKNPRWRPFSKMDTHKINLRHKAGPIWTN